MLVGVETITSIFLQHITIITVGRRRSQQESLSIGRSGADDQNHEFVATSNELQSIEERCQRSDEIAEQRPI